MLGWIEDNDLALETYTVDVIGKAATADHVVARLCTLLGKKPITIRIRDVPIYTDISTEFGTTSFSIMVTGHIGLIQFADSLCGPRPGIEYEQFIPREVKNKPLFGMPIIWGNDQAALKVKVFEKGRVFDMDGKKIKAGELKKGDKIDLDVTACAWFRPATGKDLQQIDADEDRENLWACGWSFNAWQIKRVELAGTSLDSADMDTCTL